MWDLIIDTILSNKKEFNKFYRKHQFELFGFDFLIDQDFRTWLIEVFPPIHIHLFLTNSYKCNTNPYLGIPNTFIAELLPQMLNDMLRITLGKLFKKKNKSRTRNTNKDTSKKDKDLGKDILKNDKAEESDYGFPNGF